MNCLVSFFPRILLRILAESVIFSVICWSGERTLTTGSRCKQKREFGGKDQLMGRSFKEYVEILELHICISICNCIDVIIFFPSIFSSIYILFTVIYVFKKFCGRSLRNYV